MTGSRESALVTGGSAGVGFALAQECVAHGHDAELDEIQLNVVSQVRLAKPIVRDMVARRAGRILFTSSPPKR
jgi:uncharacterized protein